jgi:signal peptidase
MKRLGKWLSYIILGLAVIFFAMILLMPTVFTGSMAIVRSSSMEPAMPAGAIALMLPVDPEKVKVGDIIAFDPPWDPDVTVSHRVIDIQHDGQILFDTKGDATEQPDPYYVPAEHVHGKVIFNVPHLGFAVNYMTEYVRSWWGLILFVALPSMLLVGSVIRDTTRSTNRRHKQMQKLLKRRQRRRYKLLILHSILTNHQSSIIIVRKDTVNDL